MQSRDLTNNSDVYAANTKRLTMAQSHEAQMEKRVSRFADNRISETRDARASERCWRFSGNLGMRHIRHQSTPAQQGCAIGTNSSKINLAALRLMENEISSASRRVFRSVRFDVRGNTFNDPETSAR